MLTSTEQNEIVKLAKVLVSTTLRNKTLEKRGMTTQRLALASTRAAEDRLREYLKEAG